MFENNRIQLMNIVTPHQSRGQASNEIRVYIVRQSESFEAANAVTLRIPIMDLSKIRPLGAVAEAVSGLEISPVGDGQCDAPPFSEKVARDASPSGMVAGTFSGLSTSGPSS